MSVKYRHEFKYIISDGELAILRQRIENILQKDSHLGDADRYNIRSLYFDDYYNRCLYENENGTDPREKFRIRIYNHSSNVINLECKRKERGKTLKTSCSLTSDECERLVSGQYLRDIAEQNTVKKKFTFEMMSRLLRPVIIVEYDRIPYVYKDGNVRVTFDTNLSSSVDIGGFLKGDVAKRPVMPAGQHLMEVKFDEFLPDFIYRALQIDNLQQTAYSKYYLCRKYKL